MTVGNKSNNDACVGLIIFGWCYSVIVQKCVLSGDVNISRGYFLLLSRTHPVFVVKSRGVVMFSEMYGFFVNDKT